MVIPTLVFAILGGIVIVTLAVSYAVFLFTWGNGVDVIDLCLRLALYVGSLFALAMVYNLFIGLFLLLDSITS